MSRKTGFKHTEETKQKMRKRRTPSFVEEYLKNNPDPIFCACGCGEEIVIKEHHKKYGIPKYIWGHGNKGRVHTEKARKNMSEGQKGNSNPRMKGKKHTFETKKKMSKSQSIAVKKRFSNPEERKKQSKRIAKLWEDPEFREMMFDATWGNPEYKENHSGENHHNWTGGLSSDYGLNWLEMRNRAIERDGHLCQFCLIEEKGREHDVHHIEPFRVFGTKGYKEANKLDNLITLCRKCHREIEPYAEGFSRLFLNREVIL